MPAGTFVFILDLKDISIHTHTHTRIMLNFLYKGLKCLEK